MRIEPIRTSVSSFPKELWKIPNSIKGLSLIMMVYLIGWGIINPFFPIYMKEILGTYTSVGIIVGIGPLIAMLMGFPFGNFLEKVSKKKTLSGILALYIPMSFVLLSLYNFFTFALYKVYHSVIASGLWLTADVYVREHSPKEKTAESIGFFDTMKTVSHVTGAIIGALLITKYSWKILYAVSLFAFIGFIASLFLPNKNKTRMIDGIRLTLKDGMLKKEIKDFIKNKELLRFSVYPFIIAFTFNFVVLLLPLFLRELDVGLIQIGIVYGLFYIPGLLEGPFSTLADRDGKGKMMNLGFILGSIAFFLLYLTEDITTIYFIYFFLAVAFYMIIPAMEGLITDKMHNEHVGEMCGAMWSIRHFGAGLGPLVAGIISDIFGLRYVFLMGGVIFVALLTILEVTE